TATRRPSAVVTSASAIPPATADRPVALLCSMPLKAFKMPTTVPNSPTNGAVDPIVARAERPRFISACTMATERSRPRLAASITSASETCCEADWNSESPVATTLAMWLFLFRSAMAIASSSLPSFNAPATCCTNTRDCLRAALYINARSIITPNEYTDSTNKIPTTIRGKALIDAHMLLRSHDVAWDCRNRAAYTYKVATISFAPSVLVTPAGPGSAIKFAATKYSDRDPAPRQASRTVLLVKRENHVDRGVNF